MVYNIMITYSAILANITVTSAVSIDSFIYMLVDENIYNFPPGRYIVLNIFYVLYPLFQHMTRPSPQSHQVFHACSKEV